MTRSTQYHWKTLPRLLKGLLKIIGRSYQNLTKNLLLLGWSYRIFSIIILQDITKDLAKVILPWFPQDLVKILPRFFPNSWNATTGRPCRCCVLASFSVLLLRLHGEKVLRMNTPFSCRGIFAWIKVVYLYWHWLQHE